MTDNIHFCKYCGEVIGLGEKFCPNCGTKKKSNWLNTSLSEPIEKLHKQIREI